MYDVILKTSYLKNFLKSQGKAFEVKLEITYFGHFFSHTCTTEAQI